MFLRITVCYCYFHVFLREYKIVWGCLLHHFHFRKNLANDSDLVLVTGASSFANLYLPDCLYPSISSYLCQTMVISASFYSTTINTRPQIDGCIKKVGKKNENIKINKQIVMTPSEQYTKTEKALNESDPSHRA